MSNLHGRIHASRIGITNERHQIRSSKPMFLCFWRSVSISIIKVNYYLLHVFLTQFKCLEKILRKLEIVQTCLAESSVVILSQPYAQHSHLFWVLNQDKAWNVLARTFFCLMLEMFFHQTKKEIYPEKFFLINT